jgi:hypothetical protein
MDLSELPDLLRAERTSQIPQVTNGDAVDGEKKDMCISHPCAAAFVVECTNGVKMTSPGSTFSVDDHRMTMLGQDPTMVEMVMADDDNIDALQKWLMLKPSIEGLRLIWVDEDAETLRGNDQKRCMTQPF